MSGWVGVGVFDELLRTLRNVLKIHRVKFCAGEVYYICFIDRFYHSNIFATFIECTHLLLAHGAPVKVKNLEGWSPLAEAISYGDRLTSK